MQAPLTVLFLCTHNSARSILAEAMLNHVGGSRFKAYSAGSSPRENQTPNPLALAILDEAGIATDGLRSKSWDTFAGEAAPTMDLIITVCDNAAGEVCPIWPGHRLGLLVHLIHLVRQPRRDLRPDVQRHLRRHLASFRCSVRPGPGRGSQLGIFTGEIASS